MLDRRALFAGVAYSAILSILLASTSGPEAATLVTRHAWHKLTKAKKDQFALGVARLKVLPTSDPRNWSNLAKVHADACRHANWWFPSWHTDYLLAYERSLQAVLGDPTFGLPYWDYFSRNAANRKLPTEFRNPAKAGNPLYNATRSASINNGTAVIPLTLADWRFALSSTVYSTTDGTQSFAGFPVAHGMRFGAGGGTSETGFHNGTHVFVGGDMGQVPIAARDPIFLLHHCQVERVFQSWIAAGKTRAGYKLPTNAAWLNEQFTMTGGNGKPTTLSTKQILAAAKAGVKYDSLLVPAAASAALVARSERAAPAEELWAAADLMLGKGMATFPVLLSHPSRAASATLQVTKLMPHVSGIFWTVRVNGSLVGSIAAISHGGHAMLPFAAMDISEALGDGVSVIITLTPDGNPDALSTLASSGGMAAMVDRIAIKG